ncbi:MAG: DUF2723 domain-containing protein [Chloroflexota bacterium]
MSKLRSFILHPLSFILFLIGFALYLNTLAPSIVFGDPTEYTLMPHLWSILHPPGYAFMTLLVKLWQIILPIGSLAYRTNLLSAVAGAVTGVMVMRSIQSLHAPRPREASNVQLLTSSSIAALSLYTATDFWQHAIHTNAHIVTVMLASISITILLIWRETKNDRWLYAFGLVAGLSLTHHPLLVFGFPAYAAFILINRPRARSLIIMSAFGACGLAPWLYFPIRSFIQPPALFGSSDLNTINGFLNLVFARGITGVNLFHFGLDEQWHRLIVFWSLIQLQYAIPILLLAIIGGAWLAKKDWKAFALISIHLISNLLFTMNSVQDVMAYLLVPIMNIAIFIGAGALGLSEWLPRLIQGWWSRRPPSGDRDSQRRSEGSLRSTLQYAQWSVALFFLFPIVNAFYWSPLISLGKLRDADRYVESVFDHFAGKNKNAILLSDWEHATPMWYHQYVNNRILYPRDVTMVYVNKPMIEAIMEHINEGSPYLLEYNPGVVDAGFRLRAEGNFYKVMPPSATTQAVQPQKTVSQNFGAVEIIGYDVLKTSARGGDSIPIILYFRANKITEEVIQPFARIGSWETRFTTDSRLLTPQWKVNELIAERWEVRVPFDAPSGDYTMKVGMSNLTTDEDFKEFVDLGSIRIEKAGFSEKPAFLVANFDNRVGIESATAWVGGNTVFNAPWQEPIQARAGDPIEIRIKWRALHPSENSYTVFVHLNDANGALIASKDYTPLGGSFPTMLWFPKWIEGQRVIDPYRITIPREADGEYYIEVGLYGLRSVVRASALDAEGKLAGDRFVLGGVRVQP